MQAFVNGPRAKADRWTWTVACPSIEQAPLGWLHWTGTDFWVEVPFTWPAYPGQDYRSFATAQEAVQHLCDRWKASNG